MTPLEINIEERFVAYVTKRGMWCPKTIVLGRRGFPDRTLFLPDGRVFFIEFKRYRKRPRATQNVLHKKLKGFGHAVQVFDTYDAAVGWFHAVVEAGALPDRRRQVAATAREQRVVRRPRHA